MKGCHSIPEPFAKEIIHLLGVAHDESPGELRRLPSSGLPSDIEPVVNVLLAVANQRALDVEIDPKVLATRKDIGDVVQGKPTRLDVYWRSELLTNDLRAVMNGEAAVTVSGTRIVIQR